MFWQTVHAGAVKASREYDFDLEWNAPSVETDSSRQIAIIESMINRRLAGLILAPVDRKALVGVVEKARSAGIPVVIFDSGLDTDKRLSYVATDNRAGGRLAARRLGTVLQGRGKVAVIGFMIGSASTMDREQGFQEEITANFPGIQIVDIRYSNSDRSVAMGLAENILTAHPDLGGFFADNEGSSTGTVQAVKSRAAKSTRVVAFDHTEQIVQDMRDGWVDSVVVQSPFRMGYESAKAIGVHFKGGIPPPNVDSGCRLIVREDLDKPEVKELLFPDLRTWLT